MSHDEIAKQYRNPAAERVVANASLLLGLVVGTGLGFTIAMVVLS